MQKKLTSKEILCQIGFHESSRCFDGILKMFIDKNGPPIIDKVLLFT